MSYYTVLGYSKNPVIDLYQESYVEYLFKIYNSLDIEDVLKSKFVSFSLSDQKQFLLHPDISSLLRNIEINPINIQTFLLELEIFCSEDHQNLTGNKWNNIGGTDIKLTLQDNNPAKDEVAHPDHDAWGMLGWGEKSENEWLDVFEKAFTLLKTTNREFYKELNYIIKKIVPMKTSVDVHNSCSFSGCIGTLYLGYTINTDDPEVGILEALIHESSHNKLNLIMQSENLHLNDSSLKYYSPYRPDARHIQWVLLWVHAIVPTVYCMIQAIHGWYIKKESWMEKIVLYHIKNKLWYKVLHKYAKFTPIGQKIYEDMGKVISLCDIMIKNYSEFRDCDFASLQGRAKKHFLEVQKDYPHVQY